jgi:hypothetical protein
LDPLVDDNVANSTTPHEANQGDYVISEITSLEPPVVAAAADEDNDNDDHPEKEVEVFRCLSCFSIFIPSGKRLIFPMMHNILWSLILCFAHFYLTRGIVTKGNVT